MTGFHPFLRYFTLAVILWIGLLVAAIAILLKASNELSVYRTNAIATDEDILWGSAFGQNHLGYKLARARYTKPDLLVLGSSRVTQFRAQMAPGISFYNAGRGASDFEGTLAFVEGLFSSHKPQVVILGIDPWWFRPPPPGGSVAQQRQYIDLDYREVVANLLSHSVKPEFLLSLLSDELKLEKDPLGERRPVGYRAVALASGFRPDGSNQYGDILLGHNLAHMSTGLGVEGGFRHYRSQIRERRGRFAYTGPLVSERLALLRQFIAFCRTSGVMPILLLTPFPAALFEEIDRKPEQKAYFESVEKSVAGIAAETNTAAYNFHRLSDFGLSDAFMLDGIHVDEFVSLRMLMTVIDDNVWLAKNIDRAAIGRIRQLARNPASVPNPHRIYR